ncbi:hypothetical protein HanXRQr2_Chr04g0147591 [Helianthus annuus]|uniref:Uncharacterized protein n=1 Tax=Helianthus annuus TaxID=4232 RepID=A0A9K3J5E6_HELAN|nr:hypothetical protein HanXRQr2_Chr04g0147591 [Helianthus annuus]KAJ0929818.1 hypothetical protein HanPSC8_Chr04g0142131 [Helianthus annuus]
MHYLQKKRMMLLAIWAFNGLPIWAIISNHFIELSLINIYFTRNYQLFNKMRHQYIRIKLKKKSP